MSREDHLRRTQRSRRVPARGEDAAARATAAAGAGSPARIRVLGVAAALALLTFVAFRGALDHSFVDWDDLQYVVENPVVLAKSPVGCLRAVVETQYHPLTLLSLAMNVSTPLSPSPFIATSLALHVADTLLVLWFVFLISGRRLGVAAAVALLFGIHPLHVESVAWISGRKDVLYTL